MAILTWRDVAAPFNGGMAGIQIAGDLFGKSMNAAQQGLEQWDQGMTEASNEAILKRALAVQDPAQANPADIIGADGGNASAEMLKYATDGRVNELEDRANTEALRQFDQYKNDRTVQTNKALDQAQPLLQEAAALEAAGKTQEALALYNKAATIPGMTFEGQVKGGNYVKGWKPNEADLRAKQEREDLIAASALAQQMRNTTDDKKLRELFYSAPGHIAFKAESINKSYGDDIATTATGRLATMGVEPSLTPEDYAPGEDEADDSFFGLRPDGTAAYGWQPSGRLSKMTADQWLTEGDTYRAITAKAGVADGQGSSAFGRYQITGPTLKQFGEKALGKDWRNVEMNGENQRKVAEAIFNARKGKEDISDTWAALKGIPEFEGKGKLAGKSFAEIDAFVTYKETGKLPPNYQGFLLLTDQKLKRDEFEKFATSPGAAAVMTTYGKGITNTFDTATEFAKKLGIKDAKGLTNINMRIEQKMREAKAAGKPVSAAEVSGALLTAMQNESLYNLENFTDGADVIDSIFNNIVNDIPTIRGEVEQHMKHKTALSEAQAAATKHGIEMAKLQEDILRGNMTNTTLAQRLGKLADASRAIGIKYNMSGGNGQGTEEKGNGIPPEEAELYAQFKAEQARKKEEADQAAVLAEQRANPKPAAGRIMEM